MKSFDKKFGADFLESVPLLPGVYRYWGEGGELLYVGKAVRLRRRLQQYRNAKRLKKHHKMRDILKASARLTFEVCETHEAACLLELQLIRELRPRFNLASAFSFLYPFVGVSQQEQEAQLSVYLTTRRELAPPEASISWHGAYRSRYWTREFFSALLDLLEFVGHRTRSKGRSKAVRGLWSASFRRFPEPLAEQLCGFLRGETANEFLSELVLALVENAGARAKKAWVQERLRICAQFYRAECERLAQIRAATNFAEYPVPQEKRDELFLRRRLQLDLLNGRRGDRNTESSSI